MPDVAEHLTIPQPGAEAIELDDEWGDLSRYQKADRQINGMFKRQGTVAPHLLASVARTASNEMPTAEIVKAARALQTADGLVRRMPAVPIIYRLHCEDAVGITPEDQTEGFTFVDKHADDEYSPHWQTVVPTQRLFRLRTGPDRREEDDESFEDDAPMSMYAALRFLVTPDQKAVNKFLHGDIGMRYVHSRVVVGQRAVDAFLTTKAREELLEGDSAAAKTSGFLDSWALLASGALKRLGGSSPIGKHGGFVHGAGMEAMADVVAVAAGYEGGISDTWRPSHDGNILRRLAGVDFDPAQDVPVVAQKATERAYSENGRAGRFDGLLYGDRAQVQSHLTEVAGNFMDHILNGRPE